VTILELHSGLGYRKQEVSQLALHPLVEANMNQNNTKHQPKEHQGIDLIKYADSTIIPSRSRYQLQNFVIGKHDTNPMRWRQILLEAQQLAYNIRMAELDIQRKQIEIERLLATGDPIDEIEAEEKRIGIIMTERALKAAELEFSWLQEAATETGAYTLKEIEEDQPRYWEARLLRQAEIEQLATRNGVSSGNLESMNSAGLLAKENEEWNMLPGNLTGPQASTELAPSKQLSTTERG
jgi:hypothetical protein